MPEQLSEQQYNDAFDVLDSIPDVSSDRRPRREAALEHALDIRKFEIQLYWTRSAYFWTFIGAALLAYGGSQTLKEPIRTDLSVLVSSVGLVFSCAWFLANKGSKQWQENWENHVDRLEDQVTGPLYKTVLRRPAAVTALQRIKHFVAGPAPYSVSKINQIISLYICVVWLLLLWEALPRFSMDARISWLYSGAVGSAVAVIVCLFVLARTHEGDMVHSATKRDLRFESPSRVPKTVSVDAVAADLRDSEA